MTVMGVDADFNARMVEIKDSSREEIQEMLKSQGWTSLYFIED